MEVFLDIETVPQQGGYERFLKEAKENFKAPTDLSKTKACADLGITGDDAKYTSKSDAIALWVDKFAEEKAPEVAKEAWLKTSFDGSRGEIFSIAWALEDGEVKAVYRDVRVVGDNVALSCEKQMLKSFFGLLNNELRKRKPYFVGHNIGGFDLKFIFHRAVILGVAPPFILPSFGRHGSGFYDTQEAWAGFKSFISQDALSNILGIEGKSEDIDGSKVWDFVKAGKGERVVEYNKDDVGKNREIYKRLNFIDSVSGLSETNKAA